MKLQKISVAAFTWVAGCNGVLDIHDLPVAPQDETSTDAGDAISTDVGDGACPIDTTTSCGACGHDCLGGACNGGVCQPVLLTGFFADPRSIAVDAEPSGGVYFADHATSTIQRKDKSGDNFTQLRWAAAGFAPTALHLDATHLYWVETQEGAAQGNDVVFQADKVDGAHRTVLGPWTWTADLGVDATDVFVLNRRGADQIVRAPIGLTSASTILSGATSAERDSILVVPGAGRLFYSGSDGISSINKDGTNARVLFGWAAATKMALDDTRVWFASMNFIGWIGIDATCAPPADVCPDRYLLDHSVATNVQLAVDADSVYWTHPLDGLQRARKDQPDIPHAEVLAKVPDIAGIALDDRAVYFTTKNGVWKVAK